MNDVTFFTIESVDPTTTAEFYRQLFRWGIEPAPDEMLYIPASGGGIPGGISTSSAARVVPFVQVDDVAASLAKAIALGAVVVQEPTNLSDGVLFATFDDPSGNRLGVWKPPTA